MDYEDDFSWEALDPNVDPQEHQDLLVVRFLIENGYIPEHFDGAPPPASKEVIFFLHCIPQSKSQISYSNLQVVANLEERKIKIDRSNPEKSLRCVICLKLDPNDPDDDDNHNEENASKDASYEKVFKVLPCSHAFHR